MKKIKFDVVFKIAILLSVVYFLIFLTIILTSISENLRNGRYQFKADSPLILDTRTGKVYYNKDGELKERN